MKYLVELKKNTLILALSSLLGCAYAYYGFGKTIDNSGFRLAAAFSIFFTAMYIVLIFVVKKKERDKIRQEDAKNEMIDEKVSAIMNKNKKNKKKRKR
ncbi:hypothetical protein [Peptostreptococcus faecalis]|uniref:hypothetical protein n=1 Tax=Peptostreptococcus faecalis TaxID=2045015 RepID=UPI000C7A2DA5|nr:hypothetical protein [Peptostreptococcus faecalis]